MAVRRLLSGSEAAAGDGDPRAPRKSNAVILANNYQLGEGQARRRYVGERWACTTGGGHRREVIFPVRGVHFMARGAILSPRRPCCCGPARRCSLADTIDGAQLRAEGQKKDKPRRGGVSYVNTTAEVKGGVRTTAAPRATPAR